MIDFAHRYQTCARLSHVGKRRKVFGPVAGVTTATQLSITPTGMSQHVDPAGSFSFARGLWVIVNPTYGVNCSIFCREIDHTLFKLSAPSDHQKTLEIDLSHGRYECQHIRNGQDAPRHQCILIPEAKTLGLQRAQ